MPRGFLYYEVARLLNPRRRKNNRSNHELLKVVVEHELRDVLEALDRGICPFCGRSFRGYMWARAHTVRSDCSLALKARIEDALRLYRKINSYVRKTGSGYYLRVGDFRTPFFKTKSQLVRYVVESGLLGKLKSAF
jgi:hypothetical protein